jgi:hypothetical protein
VGGPENGNFPLLYVAKMSLRRWVVQKRLKIPLRNINMAPYSDSIWVQIIYQSGFLFFRDLQTNSIFKRKCPGELEVRSKNQCNAAGPLDFATLIYIRVVSTISFTL